MQHNTLKKNAYNKGFSVPYLRQHISMVGGTYKTGSITIFRKQYNGQYATIQPNRSEGCLDPHNLKFPSSCPSNLDGQKLITDHQPEFN